MGKGERRRAGILFILAFSFMMIFMANVYAEEDKCLSANECSFCSGTDNPTMKGYILKIEGVKKCDANGNPTEEPAEGFNGEYKFIQSGDCAYYIAEPKGVLTSLTYGNIESSNIFPFYFYTDHGEYTSDTNYFTFDAGESCTEEMTAINSFSCRQIGNGDNFYSGTATLTPCKEDSCYRLYNQETYKDKNYECDAGTFIAKQDNALLMNIHGWMVDDDGVSWKTEINDNVNLDSFGSGFFGKSNIAVGFSVDEKSKPITNVKIKIPGSLGRRHRYYLLKTEGHIINNNVYKAYEANWQFSKFLNLNGDIQKGDYLEIRFLGSPCPTSHSQRQPVYIRGDFASAFFREFPEPAALAPKYFQRTDSNYLDRLANSKGVIYSYATNSEVIGREDMISPDKRFDCYIVEKEEDYSKCSSARYNIVENENWEAGNNLRYKEWQGFKSFEECIIDPYEYKISNVFGFPELMKVPYTRASNIPFKCISAKDGFDTTTTLKQMCDSGDNALKCYKLESKKPLDDGRLRNADLKYGNNDLYYSVEYDCAGCKSACSCPDKQDAYGKIKLRVDARDSAGPDFEVPEKGKNLYKDDEFSFELSLNGSRGIINWQEPYYDEAKRNLLCSVPESFEVKIKMGGWYYDLPPAMHLVKDWFPRSGLKENAYQFIEQAEKMKKEISSVFSGVIKMAGKDDGFYFVPAGYVDNMIQHSEKDDTILIEEQVTINVVFTGHGQSASPLDSIDVYIEDRIVGNPEKMESYSEAYSELDADSQERIIYSVKSILESGEFAGYGPVVIDNIAKDFALYLPDDSYEVESICRRHTPNKDFSLTSKERNDLIDAVKKHSSGKIKRVKVRGNLRTEHVRIAEGEGALQMYSGLFSEMIKMIPASAKKISEVAKPRTKEIRLDYTGKVVGMAHVLPVIEENSLGNIQDFAINKKSCCSYQPEQNIPYSEPGKCPERADKFEGYFKASNDLKSTLSLIGFLNIPVLKQNPDILTSVSLDIENADYTAKDRIEKMLSCGVGNKAKMTMRLSGVYYDYPMQDANLFSEARKKALNKFPPKMLIDLFKGKKVLFSEAEVSDKIDMGDVLGEIDDSQWIEEIIALTISKESGKIDVEIEDRIFTEPLDNKVHQSNKKLAEPNPFSENLKSSSTYISGEPGISMAFSGIAKKMAENVYSMKNNREITEPMIIDKDGQTVLITPSIEHDVSELARYSNMKDKCCSEGIKQESSAEEKKVSSSGEGASVYMIRNEYGLEGEAYMISADLNLPNSSKIFYHDELYNEDLGVYKLDNSEIDYCNYSVAGERSYSGSGNFFSSDGKFSLNVSGYAGAMNISSIIINQCGLNNLNFSNADVMEINQAIPEIKDVLKSVREYYSGLLNKDEAMLEILKWKFS